MFDPASGRMGQLQEEALWETQMQVEQAKRHGRSFLGALWVNCDMQGVQT